MAGHMKRVGVGNTRQHSQVNNPDGRPREYVYTGISYALSEWLDKNFDLALAKLNISKREAAEDFGYTNPNIFSMWRTGKVRIPLDRLVKLAEVTDTDIARLLPMWLDQYIGKPNPKKPTQIIRGSEEEVLLKAINRIVSPVELEAVEAIRKTQKNSSTDLSEEMIEAIGMVVASQENAEKAIAALS